MEKVKELAEKMKYLPKLRLGTKLPKGGVQSTGPHKVKFLEEPVFVKGTDDRGKERDEMKFVVEENGQKFRWNVPILNKEGKPSHLMDGLMEVKVGDERILEILKFGSKNYTSMRKVDEKPSIPEEDEPAPF